jgi:polyhydroxybutyrate depolymerase|tara:strand:+ start:762 stop:1901 length:1140 start_codon:yes stop_codon:yes gene_type:complete
MTNKQRVLVLVTAVLCCHFMAQAQFTSFQHESISRQYIYYEPSELNENRSLVFVMHGFTGDANGMRNYSQMNQIANQYGFAVCYPRGTLDSDGDRFWNVGYAFHQSETVNDVGFLTELAEHLQITYNLNPDYTFATGFSNGGEMCYMLACQAYDTFKAVAPVAGMIIQDILDNCDNSPAIPLFEIHGSQDNVTPVSGDPTNTDGWGAYPSISSTIAYFSDKNQCTSVITETLVNTNTSDGSYVVSEKHLNGITNNEVWYYKVVGGGHDWPGNEGNMDINAGEEAWLFFQKHIDDTLSTASLETVEKSMQLIPNPSSTLIQLKSSLELELQEVVLYSTLGVPIQKKIINNQIDITHLDSGLYVLHIKTSKGTITKKIIKN